MTILSGLSGHGFRAVATVLTVAAGLAVTSAAHAQKEKGAQAQQQSAWVKLCEKTKLPKGGKPEAGKQPEFEEKDICLTHHERLDGNTGMVIISAAIRQVEGQKTPSLMVMVPLGMALPAGVKAAVYNKDQWARAQKKERVDDKELKPLALKYSLCHPAGCTAEIAAPQDLVKNMESGGGLMVLALNAAGQPVAFPVPLTGFSDAHKGKPVDNKAYGAARQRLMGQIRERMRQRIANTATGGNLPAPKKN